MPKQTRGRIILQCLFLLLILILGGALISQAGGLGRSLHLLGQARPLLLIGGVAALVVSFVSAAGSWHLLAVQPVPFRTMLLVQVASGFTNRLLPGGLGAQGLYGYVMHKRGHSLEQASAVVVANIILGFAGNMLLVLLTFAIMPHYLHELHPTVPRYLLAIVGLAVVLLAVVLRWLAGRYPVLRRRLQSGLDTFRSLLLRKRSSLGGLLCNMGITASLALCLSLSLASIGWHLAWPLALLALTVGTFAGAAIPSPGGFGGVEAGLTTMLVALGVPTATALAGVLIYRFLTFWLPIIPGVAAFIVVKRRYL